jgi:hypothetical protein
MRLRVTVAGLIAAGVVAGTVASAGATNGSGELNLHGGDKLQADAFHCGTNAKLIKGRQQRVAGFDVTLTQVDGEDVTLRVVGG